MLIDMGKMDKAKTVLLKIAKGIDPMTGELITEKGCMNDPEIIRCFYFITEVLDKVMDGSYGKTNRLSQFCITQDQKNIVRFPENAIGVNEFSRQVNMCIDTSISKKLTGTELNKRLRKMGILGEVANQATGGLRTVINSNSEKYGFELEKRFFHGTEYDMVVLNNKGKQYILDHIEEIMNMDLSECRQ